MLNQVNYKSETVLKCYDINFRQNIVAFVEMYKMHFLYFNVLKLTRYVLTNSFIKVHIQSVFYARIVINIDILMGLLIFIFVHGNKAKTLQFQFQPWLSLLFQHSFRFLNWMMRWQKMGYQYIAQYFHILQVYFTYMFDIKDAHSFKRGQDYLLKDLTQKCIIQQEQYEFNDEIINSMYV
ncbi:unnamed protein product (macronuclear) [Paramecium tetraurelia]|uniref:Transmembrane protein n=1 Tax=Paramecium tetraurelia TaxID=5888 RepID=A0C9A6_PARTE|nr:uncharacterized protein GSPATT00006679001 [Paramecium tetraurelia]CAK67373.1 unnamed protein product [Paramecium tetraurelia]|eukprot:XP_001434770.1 hypothetical protein (macronuclear) [Paramecium tetraurelia strain d4-2]